MAGRLIRLFLADGDADGIKTMEISNLTIFGTMFPRPMFDQFKKRREANKPGVYLIFGEDYDTGNTKLYIGEGDPISPRLNSHYGNKDFWTDAVTFTSKDDYLTKTQIQYLEAKLIKLAKEADRVILDNVNIPNEPNISEVDQAEVSIFLENILLLMKAMGYTFFIPMATSVNTGTTDEDIYTMTYNNAEAKMAIRDGKYVLLSGSTINKKEVNAVPKSVKEMRRKMLDNNWIEPLNDKLMQVNQDFEFNSPSFAAGIVSGSSVNGLLYWKINGKTLKDIEIERAEQMDNGN